MGVKKGRFKMTSKEYVYELTLDEALQKLDITLYDRNCDIRVIKARQQLIDVIRKETSKLKKDLEVLEILKNKRVNINKIIKVGKLENYNSICAIGTDLTFEEYKKIKQWLERKE